MRIGLRGPEGTSTITLDDSATVGDFISLVSEKTSVLDFDLKSGFPPQPVSLDQFDSGLKLQETGLKLNGEQLLVLPRNVGAKLKNPMAGSQPSMNPPAYTGPPAASTTSAGQPAWFSPPPGPPPSKPDSATASNFASTTKDPSSSEVPEVPIPAQNAILTLRIMPDDNSCMFRALGSAVLGSTVDAMTELRGIVASTIQSDPVSYSEAILGKPTDEYCSWIQQEDSWGGGIELAILSQSFDLEVCSIDVQSLRVDRFNEGKARRCILVYSGIHYDVLALTPAANVSDEYDTKLFDAADEDVLAGAVQLCQELQKKHYYTDTAGFDIRCYDCGWTGKGEKAAVNHAESTGHYNFGEN